MKKWVRRSLKVGALTAGALLAGGGGAAHAQPNLVTTDNAGAGDGAQGQTPIQAPVNACGSAAAVAGFAAAGCEGGSAASLDPEWSFRHFQPASSGNVGVSHGTQGYAMVGSGNLGVLNGTQPAVPVQIPIDICGNAIAVLGVATAACGGVATAACGGRTTAS